MEGADTMATDVNQNLTKTVGEGVWMAAKQEVSTFVDGDEIVTTTTRRLVRRKLRTVSVDFTLNQPPTSMSQLIYDTASSTSQQPSGCQLLTGTPETMLPLENDGLRESIEFVSNGGLTGRRNNGFVQRRPVLRGRDANNVDNCSTKALVLRHRDTDVVPVVYSSPTMNPMTTSVQVMVERQRNEFLQLFPQFAKSLKSSQPEVTVQRSIQPDGSVLTTETKVMRRQVQYHKMTTIVNGLVQSSKSRVLMIYGGPKNGYQVKFEQIQGTSEDSEDDEEEDQEQSPRLSLTSAPETDENSFELKSALVRWEDTKKSIVKPKLSKLDKAWLSAKELVDSERRYVEKLHLLDQVFRPKVEAIRDKLAATHKVDKLFSNLTSLYTFHSEHLLPSLESRLTDWKRGERICDVMCKLAPYLKMYSEYTNNYNKATKIYEELRKKNKHFACIVHEMQTMPECGNLPLDAHIICPVQRVARYHLLLQQYLDNLPSDHVDRPDAEVALGKVKDSASHANNLMRKLDKYRDVIEIQESLGSQLQDLVTPSRELVKKGRLTKISRRSADRQERYVFLFNDLLLLCSDRRISLTKFKLRAALPFDALQVLESDNLEFEHTFAVRYKNRVVEFMGKSANEKDEWMESLWSTVQQFTEDRESFTKVRFAESDMKSECHPEKAPNCCTICKSNFKLLINDEFKCQSCKLPICKKCLIKDSNAKLRVCSNCSATKEHESSPAVDSCDRNSTADNLNKQRIVEGFLEIRSPKTAWSNRYFVLTSDSMLQSSKNEKIVSGGGALLLHGAKVNIVDPRQDSAAQVNSHVLKIVHPNRVYYLKTPTEAEMVKWMAALELASQAEPNVN